MRSFAATETSIDGMWPLIMLWTFCRAVGVGVAADVCSAADAAGAGVGPSACWQAPIAKRDISAPAARRRHPVRRCESTPGKTVLKGVLMRIVARELYPRTADRVGFVGVWLDKQDRTHRPVGSTLGRHANVIECDPV